MSQWTRNLAAVGLTAVVLGCGGASTVRDDAGLIAWVVPGDGAEALLIHDGHVIELASEVVNARDAETGAIAWSVTGPPLSGGPLTAVVREGVLVVAPMFDPAMAFDPETGDEVSVPEWVDDLTAVDWPEQDAAMEALGDRVRESPDAVWRSFGDHDFTWSDARDGTVLELGPYSVVNTFNDGLFVFADTGEVVTRLELGRREYDAGPAALEGDLAVLVLADGRMVALRSAAQASGTEGE